MGLESADAGMAPTFWQFQQYPAEFRHKISVIHDGIDTKVCVPNPDASIEIKTPDGALTTLRQGDEIVTFVVRNLEPYRGFPQFMRAARSEEHTSELQSLMRISYAVFCLKKKNKLSENT